MIKILASSSAQKGKLFEEFVKKMLDGSGFHEFRTVNKTGRQIDILAEDRVINQPIICECKAYAAELDGDHLTKFRGLYYIEYDKNNSLIGLFFSLSGLGGGFVELYKEMCESSEDLEKRFKIFSYEEIYNLLKKANIIESIDVIKHIIHEKLPYEIKDLYLSVSEYGEYWVSIFGIDDTESHFTILSSKGEEVQKYIIENLMEIDNRIKDLIPINLNVRTKVILNLCDQKLKTVEEISKEIGESQIDIQMVLSNLHREEIILEIDDKQKVSEELDIFIRLSKEFIPSDHKYEYFRSHYTQNMIDERLLNYIQTRFFISFEEEMKRPIINLLKISPSAVLNLISYTTEYYKKEFDRISEFPKETREIWLEITKESILTKLVKALISDIDDRNHVNLLSDKNIKGYSLQINAKFASLEELYALINIKSHYMIAQAVGEIGPSQLVSAANEELNLENAMILCHLKEYDSALKEYNDIIENSSDSKLISAAWNNKGLVYEVKENTMESIMECYQNSVDLDNTTKEPHFNYGRILLESYKENGDISYLEKSIEHLEKAFEIDENFEEAKKYLEEANQLINS